MDKLSKFYFDLATDAKKMEKYANSSVDIKERMLVGAGVSSADKIVSLNQQELTEHMADILGEEVGAWKNLCSNTTNNTNNNIGMLGH